MVALLVFGDGDRASEVEAIVGEAGFRSIRYDDPVKALDSLPEIAPDVILMDAVDFPHHLEVAEGMLKCSPSLSGSAILPVRPASSGAVTEPRTTTSTGTGGAPGERRTESSIGRLAGEGLSAALLRLRSGRESLPSILRFAHGSPGHIHFMFSHPRTLTPVSCRIDALSALGTQVTPDNASLAAEIVPGTRIPGCTLSMEDRIVECSCLVDHARKGLSLLFTDIGEADRAAIAAAVSAHLVARVVPGG